MGFTVGVLTYQDLVNFGWLLFLTIFGLLCYLIFSLWTTRSVTCPSPYTGRHLRKGSDLPWKSREKVLRYLYDMHDYDNRMFDLTQAAVCRDTGRIFSDAFTWYGSMKVDWSFIQRRHKGNFVSWGSLTDVQKVMIMDKHRSLEGFQTENSSLTPSPRLVEPVFAMTKPGPLYVDIKTGVLIGWKSVPDTELEVLIVQKPVEIYIPGLHKKD